MKKNFIMMMVASAALTFMACNSQKTADPADDAAVELTDSIKAEAVTLYEAVRDGHQALVESVAQLTDDKRAIPAQYFMPVEAAENAQTVEQKCALLGCYIVDNQTETLVYGTEPQAERQAVIARLAVETNLRSEAQVAEEAEETEAEALNKMQDFTAEDFRAALDADNADNLVVTMVYAVVEATLNNQKVYELNNGFIDDVAIAEQVALQQPLLSNVLSLIDLLAPHYDSMEGLKAIGDKVKAIVDAEDEDTKLAAILAYNGYIRELRGKLNVAVDAE